LAVHKLVNICPYLDDMMEVLIMNLGKKLGQPCKLIPPKNIFLN
jgi:hypothetical protein